jgi:hypothetical protein
MEIRNQNIGTQRKTEARSLHLKGDLSFNDDQSGTTWGLLSGELNHTDENGFVRH